MKGSAFIESIWKQFFIDLGGNNKDYAMFFEMPNNVSFKVSNHSKGLWQTGKLTCLFSRVLGSKWLSPLNSFFGGFPQPLPIYVSQSPKLSGPTAHYHLSRLAFLFSV